MAAEFKNKFCKHESKERTHTHTHTQYYIIIIKMLLLFRNKLNFFLLCFYLNKSRQSVRGLSVRDTTFENSFFLAFLFFRGWPSLCRFEGCTKWWAMFFIVVYILLNLSIQYNKMIKKKKQIDRHFRIYWVGLRLEMR